MTPTPDAKGQPEQCDKAAAEIVLALEAEYAAGRRSRDVDLARTEKALADECGNSLRLSRLLADALDYLDYYDKEAAEEIRLADPTPMPETQEETMHPKDVKGAQPEQLVEEARQRAAVGRELFNRAADARREPKASVLSSRNHQAVEYIPVLAQTADALATALSECREALKTTQHWLEQQDFEEALNVVDAALALAAQPPSEASERSGTDGHG